MFTTLTPSDKKWHLHSQVDKKIKKLQPYSSLSQQDIMGLQQEKGM